ncbi:hypothetical protein DICVIV_13992 [Dictyocaulus viviparus]|uniref:SNF2 N-terminal domain-containing protein n=1 Tax=Dictyocaulus viviparus TaxID=29172 RepID=A0A0D8X6B5_DICVI|nr:hypothetical protein DICVIV_13992 [Dictyocaulus viviparus]
MGLRKTLLMIALIVQSKAVYKNKNKGALQQLTENQRGVKSSSAILVIALASLKHQWESEIKSKCEFRPMKVAVHNNFNKDIIYKMLSLNDILITCW